MRLVATLATLAACGTPAKAPAPIANRDAVVASGCPAEASPFEPGEPITAADECVHGEPSPWFTAPAGPPVCHVYTPTGPTSAVEAITLTDGRRIWLWTGGCAHHTWELRGPLVAPVDRRDRVAVLRAGAAFLDDVAAFAPELHLEHDAELIRAAAPAAPDDYFPIGSGDNFASVGILADTEIISVAVDFPL